MDQTRELVWVMHSNCRLKYLKSRVHNISKVRFVTVRILEKEMAGYKFMNGSVLILKNKKF